MFVFGLGFFPLLKSCVLVCHLQFQLEVVAYEMEFNADFLHLIDLNQLQFVESSADSFTVLVASCLVHFYDGVSFLSLKLHMDFRMKCSG